MQRIQFYVGEERHVRLMIHATNNEPFLIRAARWELFCAGEREAEGECIIDEHVIDAKISPARKTTYQFNFTYQVADETLIEQIEVVVK